MFCLDDQKGRALGFFGKLLSNFGGGAESCPTCGGALDNDGLADGVFWCEGCSRLVRPENGAAGGSGRTCAACEASLDDGDHYLPYEDGSNAYAYIRCRCGFENIQFGFSEDD